MSFLLKGYGAVYMASVRNPVVVGRKNIKSQKIKQ